LPTGSLGRKVRFDMLKFRVDDEAERFRRKTVERTQGFQRHAVDMPGYFGFNCLLVRFVVPCELWSSEKVRFGR
jgi:hypothetical protein